MCVPKLPEPDGIHHHVTFGSVEKITEGWVVYSVLTELNRETGIAMMPMAAGISAAKRDDKDPRCGRVRPARQTTRRPCRAGPPSRRTSSAVRGYRSRCRR